METWEYKHIRFEYQGKGVKQLIQKLYINCVREEAEGGDENLPTLPELLANLGLEGWEMVSYVLGQDSSFDGVPCHYYVFKRKIS